MSLDSEINSLNNLIVERTKKFEIENSKLDVKITTYTYWAWSFVIMGFLVGIIGLCLFIKRGPTEYNLNLIGDFYGGSVASIWSLAGLFFIYVAFLGQRQQLLNQQLEIMYSQVEIKYTRFELEGQKREMIEQNQTLRHQRFENTFFQLLKNHQDILNGIDLLRGEKEAIRGRDCFKTFYNRFQSRIVGKKDLETVLSIYMRFYHDYQADLGHYFRNLYHILKFIKLSIEISEEDKFKYACLLRALLSSYELTLLFYNGLGEYGKDYFKPLIEDFSFLKNLDKNLLINEFHIDAYKELAFSSSSKRRELLSKESNIE